MKTDILPFHPVASKSFSCIEEEIYWSLNHGTEIPTLAKIRGKLPKDIHGPANVKPKLSRNRIHRETRYTLRGDYRIPNRTGFYDE